jgi:hypothetical protein
MSTNLPTFGVDSPAPWTGANTPVQKTIAKGTFTLMEIMVSSPVYLTSAERDVEWNGNRYFAAVPYNVSNIRNNPHSAPEPMRVMLGNCKRSLLAAVFAEPIQGKDFIIRKTAWLPGSTIVPPYILYSGWIDTVQVDEKQDTGAISIEVKNDFLRWQSGVPKNTFGAGCNWMFKSGTPGCQYVGAASLCDRTWENCIALQNTDRFRGFRVIPLIEDRQFWWGRSRAW